jgi:hypothetical protein
LDGSPVLLGASNGTRFDILLDCGPIAISRVDLGIVIPEGIDPNTVDFGPGCEAPPPEGDGCQHAEVGALGGTVDPVQSGARGPGLTTPEGVRADTVYFSAVGNLSPGGRLCNPNEEDVPLAILEMGEPPEEQADTPSLTSSGVVALGGTPLTDPNGNPLAPEEYAFVMGALEPTIELELRPVVDELPGTRWAVLLRSDWWLHQVAFGLVGPADVSESEMRWVGCDTPDGDLRRCEAHSKLGPYVDPNDSFTLGPDPNPPAPRSSDTLYVVLKGNLEAGFPNKTLNVPGLQQVELGMVEFSSADHAAPDWLAGRVLGVPEVSEEFLKTDLSSVPIAEVSQRSVNIPGADFDDDGRHDDGDNCQYTWNPDQENRGALQTLEPDKYGDACQCGESDGTGAIYAADPDRLQEVLAGLVTDPQAWERCSVAEGPDCNILDVVVIRRQLEGQAPEIAAVCTAAVEH